MHLLCSQKVIPFPLLHLPILDLLQVLQILGMVNQIPSARIVPHVQIVVCIVILWRSATCYMVFCLVSSSPEDSQLQNIILFIKYLKMIHLLMLCQLSKNKFSNCLP
jgi:hypothetical protein